MRWRRFVVADLLARDGRQLVHLAPDLAFRDGQACAFKVLGDLAVDVFLARLLEVGLDDGTPVFLGAFLVQAHLLGRPQAQQFVAPGDSLELLRLIEGEFGLEALFPIVEGSHARLRQAARRAGRERGGL